MFKNNLKYERLYRKQYDHHFNLFCGVCQRAFTTFLLTYKDYAVMPTKHILEKKKKNKQITCNSFSNLDNFHANYSIV